jgi:hypothetical protein
MTSKTKRQHLANNINFAACRRKPQRPQGVST